MYLLLANTFGNDIDAPLDPITPGFSTGDFYSSLIQVIVVLAIIIGIIIVLIRYLAMKSKRWSGERSLRIYAGVALGQNKSLQIIEIGNAVYIVGVGDTITLLDKIDDPVRAGELLSSLVARSAPSAAGTAAAALSQWTAKWRSRRKPPNEDDELHNNEAFRELLEKKLKGVSSRKDAVKSWTEEDER